MTAALLAIAVLVGLDQLTKWAAHNFITPENPVQVLPFFNLVNLRNEGAAFGILQFLGNNVFIFISIIAVLIIFFMLRSKKEHPLGLILIMAGAIGNLIDRLTLGYVRDFADFFAGRYHWPAFNFADAYITVGIFALLVLSFRKKK